MEKICVAGYSGHAYVVAEIITLLHHSLIGYLDLRQQQHNPFNLKYLGNENETDLSYFIKENIHVALGLGDNNARKTLFEFFKKNKLSIKTLLHPRAVVSNFSVIEEGTVIMAAAVINPFTKIGKAVICNSGCIIEHECFINNYAHIAPGAVLAGNVTVGESSFIGANSVVKQGIEIGSNVIVGAGSVVLNNIPDNTVVYGNPAKVKVI